MSASARRSARPTRGTGDRPSDRKDLDGFDPFARRRALEQRLDDGYRRIEEARLNRLDIRAWEDFWIQLLREYERVCDDIGTLAA